MIRDILVCLEGSRSSETATDVSISLARELGARLAGLSLAAEPGLDAGFAGRCRAAEVPARALAYVGGPAARVLAKMTSHDLTVLGRDAEFRFDTERDDPATRDQILRRGARPVLLVPEVTAPPLGQKILVAYDGSGAAKRAAASVARSGLAATRAIIVATVDDDGAGAWAMANKGVLLLRREGIFATARDVVSTRPPAEALLDLAGELGAGVIVMGAHAHPAHLFGGSAMRGLVERSGIPLYLQP